MGKKIQHRYIAIATCAIAGLLARPADVHAGDLVIAPVNSVQQAMAVYENGQKIGQVGVPIKLGDGKHQLAIVGDDNYGVKMDVSVNSGVIHVDKASYELPSAVSETCDVSKAGLTDIKFSKSEKGDTTKLKLPDGVKGGQLKTVFAKDADCALYFRKAEMSVTGSCDSNMVELDASSTPEGAEIFVDGHDMGATNSDLSLTYCTGHDKPKHVEIKLAGRSLCQADLALIPNKVYPLACKKP